jgi:hypothetical protein
MDKYYANPYFLMKMCFLLLVGVHAMVFHKSVYGNTEAIDAEVQRTGQMPGIAKAAAISSLCLWIGIACCGRWIAYYEPKDKNGKPAAGLTVPGGAVPGATLPSPAVPAPSAIAATLQH